MHPSTTLDEWFVTTILPHEASLVRYLNRMWRNSADVADICQEVYIRIYNAAARQRPEFPKSFLFTTARNMLADKARREHIVSVDYTHDSVLLDVLTDELSPERQCAADEDFQRLAAAYNGLSANFRDVIWLLRVEGLSQKEAAQRLQINEGTLESRLNRAVSALTRAVARECTVGGDRPMKRLRLAVKSSSSKVLSIQCDTRTGNVSLNPSASMQAAAAHAP